MNQANHAKKALGYFLAPLVIAAFCALALYGTMYIALPDDLAQYGVVFTVFSFFLAGFYVITALPCMIMTLWHSIAAMVKERKFVLPIVYLHLNLLSAGLWVYWICLLFLH